MHVKYKLYTNLMYTCKVKKTNQFWQKFYVSKVKQLENTIMVDGFNVH